jgi:1-acyl-sn-glycerol-3-phosphate acyltransferase
VIYAFLRALMRFMTSVYLVGLFKIEGLENVPREGPLLVCPNHFGTLDPPMVPAFLPRSDAWSMAKSEYFQKPYLRWLFRSYHAFPVVRHTADRNALRRSFDLLKAGHVLILYPEGTRVEAGVLSTPEPGAGFIAQKAACPVLPVALTGSACRSSSCSGAPTENAFRMKKLPRRSWSRSRSFSRPINAERSAMWSR